MSGLAGESGALVLRKNPHVSVPKIESDFALLPLVAMERLHKKSLVLAQSWKVIYKFAKLIVLEQNYHFSQFRGTDFSVAKLPIQNAVTSPNAPNLAVVGPKVAKILVEMVTSQESLVIIARRSSKQILKVVTSKLALK